MSSPVSFRDRIPPGFVTLVVVYAFGMAALASIRYFELEDFFFPKDFLHDLTILAIIVGPLYIAGYFIMAFHPEWWSKDNFPAD